MDYSLLFAVENDLSVRQNYSYLYEIHILTNHHNSSAGNSVYTGSAPGGGRPTNLMATPFQGSRHLYQSQPMKYQYYYHMAIIDYLQDYNTRKKLEYFWRTNMLQNDKEQISCVPSG